MKGLKNITFGKMCIYMLIAVTGLSLVSILAILAICIAPVVGLVLLVNMLYNKGAIDFSRKAVPPPRRNKKLVIEDENLFV